MSDEAARLFVALELPAVARTRLAQWCVERLGPVAGELETPAGERLVTPAGLRPLKPDAMHVTLCFLGSRPVAEIDQIARACETPAGQRSVALSTGEALWLPPRRPGVVAIELRDRERRLAELQSGLSRELSIGSWYEPDRRPFRGHVTVARVARRARVRAFELPAPAPIAFCATELTLFRSRPGEPGARYERLATVRLTGGS